MFLTDQERHDALSQELDEIETKIKDLESEKFKIKLRMDILEDHL